MGFLVRRNFLGRPAAESIRHDLHDVQSKERRLGDEKGKSLFVDGHQFAFRFSDGRGTPGVIVDQGHFP